MTTQTIETKLNNDLIEISKWCEENKMIIDYQDHQHSTKVAAFTHNWFCRADKWREHRIYTYQLISITQHYKLNDIKIIIIRQSLCPVVGRMPQHVVPKLPCLVLSSAISCRSSISSGRLSNAWLVSFVVFSCHMVSKWWRARSIGRLWGGWYALPRTISFFSQCRLYISVVLSLTQMLVLLYLYVMLSILLSILVCGPQVCSGLVWSVSSVPYIIAGSTHELYTCLFRQMARLLLKISRCFAYAAPPAMILRCIFVLVLFLEAVVLSQVHVALDVLYQHIVHVYWGVVYNHHLCLCDVHLKTHSSTFIGYFL